MVDQMSSSSGTGAALGPNARPLDRLLDAFVAAGWKVALREPVVSPRSRNPTRVDLRHAQVVRRLLVYSWFITGEGKGRKKRDFRIQTTRAHTGPLMTESPRITVGVGWDRDREVFGAFDGWTKRQTGGSSSVHIKADLLDRAKVNGWAVDPPRWDARVAFDAPHAGQFLTWVDQMASRREALLNPLDYTINGDEAQIVGDIWANQPTGWLRVGDRIVMIDDMGAMRHDALWKITGMTAQTIKTASGHYNRTRITLACEKTGRIKDAAALDELR